MDHRAQVMQAVDAAAHNQTLVLVAGATHPQMCDVRRLLGAPVFTRPSCADPMVAPMSDYTIDTKFGRADVRVHRTAVGWRAMLVGRHLVPYPPSLSGPPARTEAEAVAELEAAVSSVAHVS